MAQTITTTTGVNPTPPVGMAPRFTGEGRFAPRRPYLHGHLAAYVLATWPMWLWMAQRMFDRSDDPFGILALIAAVVGATRGAGLREGGTVGDDRPSPVGCLILFALSASFLPMLVRSGFAMLGLALLISPRLNLSTIGLLTLSLPVVATMQFYLGYPLRLIVVHAVSALFALAGYPVHINGTDLLWHDHIIGIDPACSGIRMLWTAFFICFASAAFHKLSNKRTLLLSSFTLAIAVLANIFRAAVLFMMEVFKSNTGIGLPEFLHQGTGVIMFVFVAASVVYVSTRMQQPSLTRSTPVAASTSPLLIAVCLACAMAPLVIPHSIGSPQSSLIKIDRRNEGARQVMIRTIALPTRQLHPAEDCFRGQGYKTRQLPNFRDAENHAWGTFEASNEHLKLKVRERITDNAGNSWCDVSSWYWAAIFGKTHGPWQSTTIAEPE